MSACISVWSAFPGQPESYKEFMVDYALGKYPDDRLFEMLNLQIEALRRSGITPSHIDSHQHLHALPRVMRVVGNVARENSPNAPCPHPLTRRSRRWTSSACGTQATSPE